MGSNSHMVAIKSDNTCVATGYNNNGQCNVTFWTNIKQVACAFYRTIGLKKDGTCLVVGYEYNGCNAKISTWKDIKQVACGSNYTVGVRNDGTCIAIGDNDYKQCNVAGWSDIKQVACGEQHTVGVKNDGTCVAIGKNTENQCNVTGWSDIIQVSCGGLHTIGLKKDGTCVAVGGGNFNQCGVTGWTDIIQIIACHNFTVGLKKDGTCVMAGYSGGIIGLNTWKDIVQISCTNTTIVGLKKDGNCVSSDAKDTVINKWEKIKSLYSDYVFNLIIPKFLLKQNNQYYTVKDNKLNLLENQTLNESDFETNGFENLNLLAKIDKTNIKLVSYAESDTLSLKITNDPYRIIDKYDNLKLIAYDETNPDEMKLKFTLKEPFRPIDKFEGKIKILKQEMK